MMSTITYTNITLFIQWIICPNLLLSQIFNHSIQTYRIVHLYNRQRRESRIILRNSLLAIFTQSFSGFVIYNKTQEKLFFKLKILPLSTRYTVDFFRRHKPFLYATGFRVKFHKFAFIERVKSRHVRTHTARGNFRRR